ncbi:ArsO family NAD(P)H-dependent flavin-containing monooxygenase [Urechidicola vernalis]|uniref:ArsO family NAD(P)H-dependent flavin-containing monooxygenase n=1 Tax=Urechidicola vernalis TaxID=3075600 RepID=A0ABU2Y2R5_9FLAO|nr:ArsO family NAD(P)H-dependent flavin-containing monooxygenase [Urechidicola sp. P050]MDT0551987.1 ArsO family NAD(P)H-dependent flavin-containing monooxygenase [Urechidicola sp. P050]
MKIYDTLVIGGGQAGLSVAYFLRRKKLEYLVLDDQDKPGGAWLKTWDSLKLFSPTEYSSLSGWGMPKSENEYPLKDEFISYLNQYEDRYEIPVQRNTRVISVLKENERFKVETNQGVLYCKTLVSATGTAQQPFIPKYPQQEIFNGLQIHSVDYRNNSNLAGKKVLVVGGGNSGAQILAEVSKVAATQWVTLEEPYMMPDDIDGRYLFNAATQKFYGKTSGTNSGSKNSLSNIVMIDSVKEARSRGVLHSKRPFTSFYETGIIWNDGTKEPIDAVIWCTGFRGNLDHLTSLNIIENNRIKTNYTRAIKEPNLWLVGYGSWTGFASATIYGVGKTARQTVNEISELLSN